MRCERGKFVRRRFEWEAGQLRDTVGDLLGELGIGVEPGADRGPTNREFIDVGKDRLDAAQIVFELSDVAREFLTERQWDRIHQVGPADLYDRIEKVSFRTQRLDQLARDLRVHRRCAAHRDVHRQVKFLAVLVEERVLAW